MSKYILKKDLPFAKAGRELAEFGDYLTVWETKGALNIPPSYYVGKVKDLDKLISEGWIEEVKDKKNIREWWHELNYEVTLSIIKDLVEKYPNEVQKEVMKHASRQMKEWYDLTKNEYTSEKILREFIKSIHDDLHQEPIKFESKKEPKSDKEPREWMLLLDSNGKVIDTIAPFKDDPMKGGYAYCMFDGLHKGQIVHKTIKVREVME